jgi:hypothetical protein
MSMNFGGFNVSEKMFSAFGGLIPPINRPGLRSTACKRAGDAKKRRPGIVPRPLKRILKGFPVSRYYLRRTIFFMFS